MTPGTLRWLRWLVAAQTVHVGAPDAQQQMSAALAALTEIDAALTAAEEAPR